MYDVCKTDAYISNPSAKNYTHKFHWEKERKKEKKNAEKDENKMLEKLKTRVGCYSQFSYYAHNTIDKYMRGYVVYPNMP